MNYNVYGRKLIKLPTPQFIIFYNGRENQPDEKELRLSDAFMPVNDKELMLECKVRMLNINYGHNEKILKASKRLNDYSYFINEVNTALDKGYEFETAIEIAINKCIENDVMTDILLKCKSEVFNMLLTEYDEKKHMNWIREEGREEGREEMLKLILILSKQGRTEDLAKAAQDKEYQKKLFDEFGL